MNPPEKPRNISSARWWMARKARPATPRRCWKIHTSISRFSRWRATMPEMPRRGISMATAGMKSFCTAFPKGGTIRSTALPELPFWKPISSMAPSCGASIWESTSARANTTPSSSSMILMATAVRKSPAKRRMARRTASGKSSATKRRIGGTRKRAPRNTDAF